MSFYKVVTNVCDMNAESGSSKTGLKGTLYIFCAAICLSTSGVLVKLIPWNAITITGFRSLFAFIVTLFFIKGERIRFTKTNIFGGICIFAASLTFIIANKLTTAANAIVLQYTAPIFVVILSALLLKKRITRLDLFGVIIVFLGITLFFFDNLNSGQLLGNIIAILSGIFYAGVFITNGSKNATPKQASLLGHLFGSIICLPFSFTKVTAQVIPWMSIVFMGVVQFGFAYLLLAKGAKLTPPLLASLISSVEPVLNTLWVLLAIGEYPGIWAIVGIVIVIFGVTFYQVLLNVKGMNKVI